VDLGVVEVFMQVMVLQVMNLDIQVDYNLLKVFLVVQLTIHVVHNLVVVAVVELVLLELMVQEVQQLIQQVLVELEKQIQFLVVQ